MIFKMFVGKYTFLFFVSNVMLVMLLQLNILTPTAQAKVVVLVPVPHTPYVKAQANIGRALAKLGHQPFLLLPRHMAEGKLVNTEGINVIEHEHFVSEVEKVVGGSHLESFWKGESESFSGYLPVFKTLENITRGILFDKDLQSKFEDIKPDLFLIGYVPPMKNIVVLPYKLGIPYAYMMSLNDLLTLRVIVNPSSVVCQDSVISGQHTFTFGDRLNNFFCNSLVYISGFLFSDNSLVSELAPHRPLMSIDELVRRSEIFISESEHILDYVRPQVPNLKLVGPAVPAKAKPLTEPLKSFVENSKKGIAVVTFGSIIFNLPEPVAKKMASAFLQLDLNVIWRVNYTSPDPRRILTSSWVPQNDLLAHSNTKVFVSHCGANGQYESLYHGVPMLCLPIFGDQPHNAQRSTIRGFGLTADIRDITDKELANLVREVSGNETYKSNIKKASKLFRQLYHTPPDTAAFWIDHVMEFGGSYMRYMGQEMPLYQFLMVDVLAFFTIVIIAFFLLLFCFCRLAYRKLCTSKPNAGRTSSKEEKSD